MKAHPVRFEVGNDDEAPAAIVEQFDEVCATVTIEAKLFTAESWREFSAQVEAAMRQMLE